MTTGLRGSHPARLLTRRAALGWLAAALAVPLLGACTHDDPRRPPEMQYGRDVCDRCGMIISDEGYAAAYRTAAGEVRRFDEPAEMFAYRAERQESAVASFVHDRDTRAWVPAEQAVYVHSAGLQTPMGLGVAAFATEDGARAVAGRVQGRVLGFEELLRDLGARPDATRGPA